MKFYPYLLTWYPNKDTYFKIVELLYNAWVTNIEAGIPFSDPAADWPVLTAINHEMVQLWATLETSLDLLEEVMSSYPDMNICLMSYINPIIQLDTWVFFERLKRIWIDSFLIPDLPVHEYWILWDKTIKQTSILSPNLSDNEILEISNLTDWFLYVLSFIWTTWTWVDYKKSLSDFIKRIRSIVWSDQKLVVWFWIKNSSDIEFLSTLSIDWYIIWSQIVRELKKWWVKWLENYINAL